MKKVIKINFIIFGILAVLFIAVILFFFQFTHGRKEMDIGAMAQGETGQRYLNAIKECELWLAEQDSESVSITSFDGLELQGLYIPAENPRACIILMHGYRSSGINDFSGVMPFYVENGFSVLLVDQRACGKSEGKYITFGVYERQDALYWAEYMDMRLENEIPIVLHGLSLGGTSVMMAADLSLPKTVCGIIADCGFTSPYDIIAHCGKEWFNIPAYPMVDILSAATKILGGFGYRACSTLDTLAASDLPIFLIHGSEDTFVPPSMTEKNIAAAKNCKGYLLVPGAGHALSYLISEQQYQESILAYLDEILPH